MFTSNSFLVCVCVCEKECVLVVIIVSVSVLWCLLKWLSQICTMLRLCVKTQLVQPWLNFPFVNRFFRINSISNKFIAISCINITELKFESNMLSSSVRYFSFTILRRFHMRLREIVRVGVYEYVSSCMNLFTLFNIFTSMPAITGSFALLQFSYELFFMCHDIFTFIDAN